MSSAFRTHTGRVIAGAELTAACETVAHVTTMTDVQSTIFAVL